MSQAVDAKHLSQEMVRRSVSVATNTEVHPAMFILLPVPSLTPRSWLRNSATSGTTPRPMRVTSRSAFLPL